MQNKPYPSFKSLVLPLSLFVLVIVLGVALFWGNPSNGIEIKAVPSNATVRIGDKNYKVGRIGLEPGDHTVTVSRDGFESNTQEVAVRAGEFETVLVALTPVSQDAQAWAARNADLYRQIEDIGGEEAREAGTEIREHNPLISVLPYRGVLFDIDYRLSAQDPNRVVIQVTADSAGTRVLAIERIRDFGYEPTDYEIEFVNLAVMPWSRDE